MPANPSAEYVAYLRKSNGRKPIPRQRALTRGHIEGIGARIVDEFSDADRTAFRKTGDALVPRESFGRMLKLLSITPGLGIAAYHADRITRDPEDTETLIRVCAVGRNPIETHSGGRYELWTATGRKRLREDANAAAYEVDHLRERVLAGRLEVAQQGRWLGGKRPFGWELDRAPVDAGGVPLLDDDGHPVKGILRLVPAEAAAVAQAHQDVLDGMSLASIARAWNDAGLRSPIRRVEWNNAEVGRVLRRPRNAALMEHQGAVIGPAAWPAIVPEDTWRAVAAILNDESRRTTPGPARRHLLSWLARCGPCGGPVVATGSSGGGRSRRMVYRCRADARGHVVRDVGAVDDYITRLVIARLSRDDAIDLLQRDLSKERDTLYREEVALEELMREENDLRKRKLLTAAEFAESRAEHMADAERIKEQLAALLQSDILAPLIVRFRDDYDGRLVIWNDYPLDRRRGVIDTLMSIRILPTRKGRPPGWRPGDSYFDDESVGITWKRDD
ncbi:MAG TPA: recombinase family protein [Streptosporangiaceae bacterium]